MSAHTSISAAEAADRLAIRELVDVAKLIVSPTTSSQLRARKHSLLPHRSDSWNQSWVYQVPLF
jgi:hypothetical protein